jgi:NTP pyrophosphatase (non-canonical NTP hydrolase)
MIDLNRIYKFLEISGAKLGDNFKVNLSLSLIDEELNELKQGCLNNDKEEIKDAIADLFFVIMNNAYFNNLNIKEIEEMYNKVCISNMSKFCSTVEEAEETVKHYLNGTHWDKLGVVIDCNWEYAEPFYIVKRIDGKILKNINYKPVNKL